MSSRLTGVCSGLAGQNLHMSRSVNYYHCSSVALDLEAVQEKLALEDRIDEETPQQSNDKKTIVYVLDNFSFQLVIFILLL